jgi:uncharacterized membrane protein YgdD (TMEM256/DUF423 family)
MKPLTPFTRLCLCAGAVFALTAVILGAFGAHALKDMLSVEMLAVYQVAVEYQIYHALGLLLVGIVADMMPQSSAVIWSGRLMIAGILIFSGSLYALSVTGLRALGAITPIGGVAFILAWACLAWAVIKKA